jgi:hypothetical protein
MVVRYPLWGVVETSPYSAVVIGSITTSSLAKKELANKTLSSANLGFNGSQPR